MGVPKGRTRRRARRSSTSLGPASSSWLMLPAIGIIIYSMLMFKNGVFRVFAPAEEGPGSSSRKAEEKGNVKVDLEEPFYIQMFTSKKLQEKMTARKVVGRSFRKGMSLRRG